MRERVEGLTGGNAIALAWTCRSPSLGCWFTSILPNCVSWKIEFGAPDCLQAQRTYLANLKCLVPSGHRSRPRVIGHEKLRISGQSVVANIPKASKGIVAAGYERNEDFSTVTRRRDVVSAPPKVMTEMMMRRPGRALSHRNDLTVNMGVNSVVIRQKIFGGHILWFSGCEACVVFLLFHE